MPMQLRPVRERESNIPSVLGNPNSLLMPQSVMQNMFLNDSTIEPLTKESNGNKNFDAKSKDLLFQIWASRDDKIIEAQRMLRTSEILFKIPSGISSYDIVRLVTEGLIINKGSNHIAFTDRGKVALGMKIMEQPSEFQKNKKKDKFVFSQTSTAVGTNSMLPIDATKLTPELVTALQSAGIEIPPEFLTATKMQIANANDINDPAGTAAEATKNLQGYTTEVAPLDAVAQGQ